MYDTIKLEKGLYHLSGKTFTQALEAADPSDQYAGTDLAALDAYERQLKRFDIRISGRNCDRVEKFFTTTESAVLFPEFVRRAVKRGMEESILPDITAASAAVHGTVCKGFAVSEGSDGYGTKTAEGDTLPATAIRETDDPISLSKYGRLITASYETIRTQRIDVFAVMLRAVGRKLAGAIAADALAVIADSAESFAPAGSALAYSDLAKLYGKFGDYELSAVIASPQTVAEILAMEQMRDRTLDSKGCVRLPFGAKLLGDSSLTPGTVVGISGSFALACLFGSDVLLESDRLIDCQLDRIAVSVYAGFQPLMSGAAAVIADE